MLADRKVWPVLKGRSSCGCCQNCTVGMTPILLPILKQSGPPEYGQMVFGLFLVSTSLGN